MGRTIAASGPTQTRLTRACKSQTHLGLVPLSTCKKARRKDSAELDQGNEAEETGQVCVNLHESRDQQGNQADERTRPPMLGAGAWEINTRKRAQGHRSPVLGRRRSSPATLPDSLVALIFEMLTITHMKSDDASKKFVSAGDDGLTVVCQTFCANQIHLIKRRS